MNRRAYIMLLMFLSWPVNLIHQVLSNRPIVKIAPFPFDGQVISVQYYLYGLLGLVSWLMIIWGIWLYVTGNYKQDRDFKAVLGANFINLCIDVPHYLLFFQQSKWVAFGQGAIILTAAIIIFNRAYKKKACKRN